MVFLSFSLGKVFHTILQITKLELQTKRTVAKKVGPENSSYITLNDNDDDDADDDCVGDDENWNRLTPHTLNTHLAHENVWHFSICSSCYISVEKSKHGYAYIWPKATGDRKININILISAIYLIFYLSVVRWMTFHCSKNFFKLQNNLAAIHASVPLCYSFMPCFCSVKLNGHSKFS